MASTSRLNMKQDHMFPGGINEDSGNDSNAPEWQQTVNKAILRSLANWATGLTGIKEAKPLILDSFEKQSFVIMDNFRTFDMENAEGAATFAAVLWCSANGGGVMNNLCGAGMPVSLSFLSGVIPGTTGKIKYREVHYEVLAVYL